MLYLFQTCFQILVPKNMKERLHLNQIVDRLPNTFNNATNVTKLHIYVVNVFARLEWPVVQTTPMRRGHGRDLQPCKRRTQGEVYAACGDVLPNIELDDFEREAPIDLTNIVINFVRGGKLWDYT